jgi:hypothetical protein
MLITNECLEQARTCRDQRAATSWPEDQAALLALEQQWRRMATRAALRDRYWGLFEDRSGC